MAETALREPEKSGSIRISLPPRGEHTIVASTEKIFFDFDSPSASFSRADNHLLVSSDTSGTVDITDFFAGAEDTLPELVFANGESVSGTVLLTRLDSDSSAATPEEGDAAVPSTGAGEYGDDPGSLLDGLDRLGSLGTFHWGRATEQPEETLGEQAGHSPGVGSLTPDSSSGMYNPVFTVFNNTGHLSGDTSTIYDGRASSGSSSPFRGISADQYNIVVGDVGGGTNVSPAINLCLLLDASGSMVDYGTGPDGQGGSYRRNDYYTQPNHGGNTSNYDYLTKAVGDIIDQLVDIIQRNPGTTINLGLIPFGCGAEIMYSGNMGSSLSEQVIDGVVARMGEGARQIISSADYGRPNPPFNVNHINPETGQYDPTYNYYTHGTSYEAAYRAAAAWFKALGSATEGGANQLYIITDGTPNDALAGATPPTVFTYKADFGSGVHEYRLTEADFGNDADALAAFAVAGGPVPNTSWIYDPVTQTFTDAHNPALSVRLEDCGLSFISSRIYTGETAATLVDAAGTSVTAKNYAAQDALNAFNEMLAELFPGNGGAELYSAAIGLFGQGNYAEYLPDFLHGGGALSEYGNQNIEDFVEQIINKILFDLVDFAPEEIRGGDAGNMIFGDAINADALLPGLAGTNLTRGDSYAILQAQFGGDASAIARFIADGTVNYMEHLQYGTALSAAGGIIRDTAEGGRGTGDRIYGGKGDDILFAQGGNDTVNAGGGDDFIHAGAGHDIVFGGTGNDTIYGGAGDDVLVGCGLRYGGLADEAALGKLIIEAGGGTYTELAQHLLANTDDIGKGSASDGTSKLYGGEGNDILIGGGGDDYLNGGAGDNILFGGAGSDIFALTPDGIAAGKDIILDFLTDTDTLDLSALLGGGTVDQFISSSVSGLAIDGSGVLSFFVDDGAGGGKDVEIHFDSGDSAYAQLAAAYNATLNPVDQQALLEAWLIHIAG